MRDKRVIIVLSIIAVGLSALLMLVLTKKSSPNIVYGEFIPPEFDIKAEKGMPDTDDKSYTAVHQDNMPFILHICGEVSVYDNSFADIYFTNDSSNTVWLKLRVFDSHDEVIAETGLIRPGEYIKTIEFNRAMSDNEAVKLRIMSYEPETYYSSGSVVLNSSIKGR